MKKLQFTPEYSAHEDDGMPSCCGIAVICELFVDDPQDERHLEDDDFSLVFSQKTKDLWKAYWEDYCVAGRVEQILATTTKDMKLHDTLFKRTGWKVLSTTKNPKTDNTITLWSYQL